MNEFFTNHIKKLNAQQNCNILAIYMVFQFSMSFHKLISKRIPVQISSHFGSMFLHRSRFDV